MKPDQQHFSIWFLASGPCGSIKMTYHDFTAANKHNMMILNTHSSSQGSWATTYLRYPWKKIIVLEINFKGCGSYVLTLLSYVHILYFSRKWQELYSRMNTKRHVSQWNWDTALEYKYAMESIWFNTIGRSSSVSSILTRLFISLGMSSLRSSVYSIMLKHHTLLEVVWFHRVHPTETSFSLFGP